MIKKRSCSLSTKDNRHFYDMVKMFIVFTIYETLFENVVTILPILNKINAWKKTGSVWFI